MRDILDPSKVASEFEPYVELSPDADAINVYFKNIPDYSKRLNDHVTLFLSLDDNKEIVGCRIKYVAVCRTLDETAHADDE